MSHSSSKKLKHTHIGNTVIIPISESDKVNTETTDCYCLLYWDKLLSYIVGSSQGPISFGYTCNEFKLCPSTLLSIDSVPQEMVKLTEFAGSAFLGIIKGSSCRYKV